MISVHCNLCGYVPGRAGGAQVFLEGLIPQINAYDEITLTVHGSAATRNWIDGFMDQPPAFKEIGGDSPGLASRFLITRKLRSQINAGEIVWSPLNQGLGENGKFKEVLTIHDLIPLHYSQRNPAYKPSFSRRSIFALRWGNSMRTARRASAVVTVSNSNVDELKAAIGPKSPEVYGAPNGIDPIKHKAAQKSLWQYSGKPDVIAVTSGSKPHKGIRTLEQVADAMPEVTFHLIGKSDRQFTQTNIVPTGRLDIEQLNSFYQTSSALFFPSRIEGFGLPVLEALVFGTPVVATDIPVLREVGGSSARYFEMDNTATAAQQLKTVLADRSVAEAMSAEGLQSIANSSPGRMPQRSIEKCSTQSRTRRPRAKCCLTRSFF